MFTVFGVTIVLYFIKILSGSRNYSNIIELVGNPGVIDIGDVDDFLEKSVIPYVCSLYDVTIKTHTNIDDVLKLQLQEWMRPKMTTKKKDSLVFILPKALAAMKEGWLQCPNEKNVRELIDRVGRNTAFKSRFVGMEKNVTCITIPLKVIQAIYGCKLNNCNIKYLKCLVNLSM